MSTIAWVIVAVFAILLVTLGAVSMWPRSQSPIKCPTTLSDARAHIVDLMQTTDERAFLVIEINGMDDFIQFTGYAKGVQLDMPLITPNQVQKRDDLTRICRKMGLPTVVNTGTDGAEFLDCDITGEPVDVAETAIAIIAELFELVDDHPVSAIRSNIEKPDSTKECN